jgi:hypothetical protein
MKRPSPARGVALAAAAAIVAAAPGARLARADEREVTTGMERIDLTNGRIVLGVLPSLGGRVVLLQTSGGENVLDSDPKYWRPPFPAPALDTKFRPWNGRIVWVGPQSAFWSQQELKPGLKKAKAVWPPDPFNETGRFEVVERTPTLLRLKGATSPVSGLAFEHEFEITGERTVRMKTTATNGRQGPVAWDLWPNTRVRPEAFPYVQLDPEQMLRVEGPKTNDPDAGAYPSTVSGPWLTFAPGASIEAPRKRLWAKAYVRPAQGLIACFVGRQLLLIRAPVVPKAKLHPEQAFIEIYRGAGKGATVLELEMHGPYETLAPGAQTSFEQTFELLDYDGPATPEGHRSRLAPLLR